MTFTKAFKAQTVTPRKCSKAENQRKAWKHIGSPTKQKILTLHHHGHSQMQIRRILKAENTIDLSQPRISKIIQEKQTRIIKHNPDRPETRGRKRKFSEAELDQVEETLEEYADVRHMNWNEVASAAGLGNLMGDYEWATLQRALKRRGRTKIVAVQKDELPEHIAKKRRKWA